MSTEHADAARRLHSYADGDPTGVLADDVEDLVDRLVGAATRMLDAAEGSTEEPFSLLLDAAFLYQYRAVALASTGDRETSRALLKHAGFIALTVALRDESAVPDLLHPSVALAGSWWAGELVQHATATPRSELLDEAVTCARLAQRMGLRPRPTTARTLAAALALRFEQAGNRDDIDEAITLGRQLVEVTGAAADRHNLGVALRTRAEYRGSVAGLDEALEVLAEASDSAEPGRAALYATSLATARLARAERDDSADNDDPAGEIRLAVDDLRRAVALTSADDPLGAARWSQLGTSLRALYDLTGASDLLDEAVAAQRRALTTLTGTRPEALGIRMNLGNSLRARYELTGEIADLGESIEQTREAVGLLCPQHPMAARLHSNLGAMLRLRYERLGTAEDLEDAVGCHTLATQLAEPGDPFRARYFSNLSAALITRYDQGGDVGDLDRAVDVGRRAVAGEGGSADRARCLSTLANALLGRFQRRHALGDLDEAITNLRRAVSLLVAGDVDRVRYLTNTGIALQYRFARTESDDDLREAVRIARQALAETPDGAPAALVRASNLAGALGLVFRRTGDLDAMDEAIELLRAVADETSSTETTARLRRSNLGLALLLRGESTGSVADLRAAVVQTRAALGPSGRPPPTLGPGDARSLINYGSAEEALGRQTGDEAGLDRAEEAWRDVTLASAALTADRVVAAAARGRSAAGRGRWAEAAEAHAGGLALLETLAWRGVQRSDNEFVLQGWQDLARDAAASALADGRVGEAVRLLDSGRGVLWAQQLDLRVDLARLAERDRGLAEALKRVRREFEPTESP